MNAENRLKELIRRLEEDAVYEELTPTLLALQIIALKNKIRELAFLVLKLDNERHGGK